MRVHVGALVVALLVLTAGCSFSNSETTTNPWERTPNASLTEKQLPETPENLTNETAVTFATHVENAYKWNEMLTDETIQLSVGVGEETVVNRTDSGYIARLEVEAKHTYLDDENQLAADDFYTVYYFVNESSIYRILSNDDGQVPDPRDGERIRG